MSWMRRHMSFANVVSIMALIFAMGGTGYAAVKLPKNSVGASQIAKNAVGASEIKRGGVGTSEVKNGSLLRTDFKAGQLPAGAQGPQGSQGSQGERGPDGPRGTFGDVTVQFVQHGADLGNMAEISIDAHCLPGQRAIGGGVRGDLTNSELTKVTASRPIIAPDNSGAPDDNGTFTGWRGTFVNENNGSGIRPEVWVICAAP